MLTLCYVYPVYPLRKWNCAPQVVEIDLSKLYIKVTINSPCPIWSQEIPLIHWPRTRANNFIVTPNLMVALSKKLSQGQPEMQQLRCNWCARIFHQNSTTVPELHGKFWKVPIHQTCIKQNTPKKSISFATFGSARHLRLHSPATGTTVESLATVSWWSVPDLWCITWWNNDFFTRLKYITLHR